MTTIQTPNTVMRLSREARRAIVLRYAQNETARLLVWTLSVALILLVLDRLLLGWLPMPWWAIVVVMALLAIGLGFVEAVRRAPDSTRSAGLLDDRLHLSSRLRSAIELGQHGDRASTGFVELAVRDAESLAGGIDARSARPIARAREWWLSLILLLAVSAAGIWLPLHNDSPKPPRPEPALRALAGLETASEITLEVEQSDASDSVREELAELEALRNELEQGVTDQAEAEARTAAQLEKLAEKLQSESDAARAREQRISESIDAARNAARAREQQWDPRVDEFAQAIREQQYEEAADQIESLNDSIDALSPDERERIAEQLEQLANAVEPDGQPDQRTSPPESTQPNPEQELSESLREQAERVRRQEQEPAKESASERPETPQADTAQNETDQEQPTPTGSQQGSDTQSESEPADDPQNRPQQSGEEGNSDPTPKEQQGERATEKSTKNQEQSGDTKNDDKAQGQQSREGEKRNGAEPSPKPGQEPNQQQDQNQNGQKPEQSKPRDGDQPGQQQLDQQSDQAGESEQSREQAQSNEQSPKQGKPGGTESDEQLPRPGEDQQQGQPQQTQDSERNGQDTGERRGQEKGTSESLERRLRQLDEQQQRIRRDQRSAEQLREQARRLTQPQQQQSQDEGRGTMRTPQNLDEQPRSRGGGDGERDPDTAPLVPDESDSSFVPVDAREQAASGGGEPVGKWYGPDGETTDPGQSSQTAQRFRRASEQAQRAIDEQQVPRRYRHLVREVFQRVQERADAIESGEPIAPQGKDAVPGGSSNDSSGTPSSSGG